jgi:hypothetical protein
VGRSRVDLTDPPTGGRFRRARRARRHVSEDGACDCRVSAPLVHSRGRLRALGYSPL